MTDLVEPAPILPQLVTDLTAIEVDRHGLAHLVWTIEQRDLYSGRLARLVLARLVMPTGMLVDVAARLLAARRKLDEAASDRPQAVN